MSFELNQGQADSKVQFLSQGKGYTNFLTSNGATMVFYKPKAQRTSARIARRHPIKEIAHDQQENVASALTMTLVKANARSKSAGLGELPGKVNYFIGNNPENWHTAVATYSKVKYEEIYPGIDLVYYGNQYQFEHDFIVAPGADLSAIKIHFEGVRGLHINPRGELVLKIKGGELRQLKPIVYQEIDGSRREISARYALRDKGDLGFEVGAYDTEKPLVIDPVLSYSTYLGGSDYDAASEIAVDASGNSYISGETHSTNFPTVNPVQSSLTTVNAFISKLNPTGTALLYSTYLGGSTHDSASAIALDSSGNAYLTGFTQSADFPTVSPLQPSRAGTYDVWVAKLNSTGTALLYSTYLGGDKNSDTALDYESSTSITVDSAGTAYVTGWTNSTTFPMVNAYQSVLSSSPTCHYGASLCPDAFVTKINPAGTALVYSTYLGGSEIDEGYDLVVDTSGNAYVLGVTFSTNFPTANALQSFLSGEYDAFVTKLNPTGTGLVFSTYLGGSSWDDPSNIKVDSSHSIYVAGSTGSTDFPMVNPYMSTSGGAEDVFVAKLNSTATAFIYSTYLGGNGDDAASGMDIGDCGNAYIVGSTTSTNFPTTIGAVQTTLGGGTDGFVTKLNRGGNALAYSTYLGGSQEDWASDVTLDGSGNAYIAGLTDSTNFPVTAGAYRTSSAGNREAFVTKLGLQDYTGETNPIAPDATASGLAAVTSSGYFKLPATLDTTVLDKAHPTEDLDPGSSATGRETEIWAQIYRPTTLSGGPYPLILFLHGNHFTCGKKNTTPRLDDNNQYALRGSCPGGYDAINNHLGYDYLATKLASWGYIVISINSNRGINGLVGPSLNAAGMDNYSGLYNADINLSRYDPALILTRGRLVLRHLQKLSEWNANGGTPSTVGISLQGKLDFANVGLMGHSRGGEGVRAAYNLYRSSGSPWQTRILSPVTFKGIFEISPTDGAADRVLDADSLPWNVLLPMCDGDLIRLPGVQPFDRLLRLVTMPPPTQFAENPKTQKSTFNVWGANHNFYNTEWQRTDSTGCIDQVPLFSYPTTNGNGSPQQKQTALTSVVAFFRANIGASANSSFNQNFDPRYGLPTVVTSVTRVERAFTRSPDIAITKVFENFDQITGLNTYGIDNDLTADVTVLHGNVPNHDPNLTALKAALINWFASGNDKYFQSNWSSQGSGVNISGYQTLDFRVSRQNDAANPAGATRFSIQLVMADGSLSAAVELCKYFELLGPVGILGSTGGSPGEYGNRHPLLPTVRIPLADFTNANLTNVRGVRFVFNGTPSGAIFLAHIRLST